MMGNDSKMRMLAWLEKTREIETTETRGDFI